MLQNLVKSLCCKGVILFFIHARPEYKKRIMHNISCKQMHCLKRLCLREARENVFREIKLSNFSNHLTKSLHGTYIRWFLRIRCAQMKENRSFRRKNPICDCSRSNEMPSTDQITEVAPYVRTYL